MDKFDTLQAILARRAAGLPEPEPTLWELAQRHCFLDMQLGDDAATRAASRAILIAAGFDPGLFKDDTP